MSCDKNIKALALFSGGLDSALAIKVVQEQGVEVIALNFVSHFFGGSNEKAEKMAEQLGVRLEYVDFREAQLEVVKNPASGRGKNMNPCIDCHALMFQTAGALMERYDASFLISGEVLGQRPMSQNYNSLRRVQKLSGMGDLILRPLSARQLPKTTPEREGWVNREKLLAIMGRRRTYQMELMEHYGLTDYPAPAGGCLLTDVDYSRRLKSFEDDEVLDQEHNHLFHLTKSARVFRFSKGNYVFIGRNEEANKNLETFREKAQYYIEAADIPGPVILMCGEFNSDEVEWAGKIFSRYSKVKGKAPVKIYVNDVIREIPPPDLDAVEKFMKQTMC